MNNIELKLKDINNLASENARLKNEIKNLNVGINLVKDYCDEEI